MCCPDSSTFLTTHNSLKLFLIIIQYVNFSKVYCSPYRESIFWLIQVTCSQLARCPDCSITACCISISTNYTTSGSLLSVSPPSTRIPWSTSARTCSPGSLVHYCWVATCPLHGCGSSLRSFQHSTHIPATTCRSSRPQRRMITIISSKLKHFNM